MPSADLFSVEGIIFLLISEKHLPKSIVFSGYSEGGVLMTDEQKHQIADMRKNGYGYAAIAEVLGISKNTIKTYCNRNGLAGVRQKTHRLILPEELFCKECGKPLAQPEKIKRLKFCSKECRTKWWSKHPEAVNQKAVYHFICKCCGKEFINYGHSNRKYCSHECYIKDRFHKDGDKV